MRHFSGSAPASPPSATLPSARLSVRLSATAAPAISTPAQKPRKAASSPATSSPAMSMIGASRMISANLAPITAPEALQQPANTSQSQSPAMAASGRPICGATTQRRVMAQSVSKGSAARVINTVKSMGSWPINGMDFSAPARCSWAAAAPANQATAPSGHTASVVSARTLNPPAWPGAVSGWQHREMRGASAAPQPPP